MAPVLQATFISASAIVGFGGVAATFGMGIQWLCLLNMFMGVVVAFIFFGRRTRKLGEAHNARTFPQLLGLHYKSGLSTDLHRLDHFFIRHAPLRRRGDEGRSRLH